MSASPEQVRIVRTVVNEFLEITGNVPCAQKILAVVLKFVEGDANQASTRCAVRDALSEFDREIDDERLNLCLELRTRWLVAIWRGCKGRKARTNWTFIPRWNCTTFTSMPSLLIGFKNGEKTAGRFLQGTK